MTDEHHGSPVKDVHWEFNWELFFDEVKKYEKSMRREMNPILPSDPKPIIEGIDPPKGVIPEPIRIDDDKGFHTEPITMIGHDDTYNDDRVPSYLKGLGLSDLMLEHNKRQSEVIVSPRIKEIQDAEKKIGEDTKKPTEGIKRRGTI